jgi:hypothetical protein
MAGKHAKPSRVQAARQSAIAETAIQRAHEKGRRQLSEELAAAIHARLGSVYRRFMEMNATPTPTSSSVDGSGTTVKTT